MHNPLAVFLFSIDHKSRLLNKIYAKIGLYKIIQPFPFEHYCVFCAKYFTYDWWYSKLHYLEDTQK